SACNDACATAWPPMMTSGAPIAGTGVMGGMLGTIQRTGGSQVTYDGKPLYYFVGDHSAGTVAGQGITHFGGSWYLVSPRGMAVEKK
ncbi:MAG: COG4315 family predicted lipoprotein, partial [Acetobacteraceae bacterium]